MKERIGFIGLGIMGTAMATRMIQAGYDVAVYNRTKEKAESCLKLGARWCSTPRAVAQSCDILFSMVSTPAVLEEIALGSTGVLSGLRTGALHIDCSTVSPELTRRLEDEYVRRGCSFLHAPVLGGVAEIKEGKLLIFVGGDGGAFTRATPVLATIGMKFWHFPHIEQATILKLMCNSVIASHVTILAQLFVVGRLTGIEPQTFLDVLSNSKLNAPTLQVKGRSMIERDFSPRFFVEHLLKDITLMINTADSFHASLPVLQSIRELFREAKDAGLEKEDYSSILKVLEQRAGISIQ